MNPARILCYLLLLTASFHSLAQEKKLWDKDYGKKQEWDKNYANKSTYFTNAGGGGSIPLTRPRNTPMGNLILYNSGGYLQVFAMNIFVYKKWGFEVNLRVHPGPYGYGYGVDTARHYISRFRHQMDVEYSDRYHDSATQRIEGSGLVGTALTGPVYKFTKGRFLFVSKLLVGMNSFGFAKGFATLQEKNGDEVIDLTYTPESKIKYSFAISPGFSVSYRLRKNLGLSLDVNYCRSAVANSYTQESYSHKTNQTSFSITHDAYVMQCLSIGASLSLLWK